MRRASTGRTVLEYTGGDRGWKGDVPSSVSDTERIRALGWANAMTSRQALRASMESMLADSREGKFGEYVLRAGRRCVFLDRDGVLNAAVVRQGRPYPALVGRRAARPSRCA